MTATYTVRIKCDRCGAEGTRSSSISGITAGQVRDKLRKAGWGIVKDYGLSIIKDYCPVCAKEVVRERQTNQ